MINSNWHPISYRFRVIAAYCSISDTLRFRATLWGLRDNVRCSAGAHWKARSGLPINVNWTFFARCYGWVATSENNSKIDDFAPTRSLWSKISGRRGRSPPNILFLLQKTRLNYLSYGIKIWTDLSSVLSQYTRVTDRRTDGQNSHRYTASALHEAR